jgi:hypothetical protein
MKRTPLFILAAIPFVSAGLTLGIRSAQNQPFPVLECPASLDLGERYLGEIAVGRFQVRNSGRSELKLEGFRATCSCAGVEREIEGEFFRIQEVQIRPGEQVELVARVAVGARPGERQTVLVVFTTNDPARPTANLEVTVPRVKDLIHAEPAAVLFGTLPVAGQARQIVNLYDNKEPGRGIARVVSPHPERFEVRLVPLSEKEARQVHSSAGRLIGRLEVQARTESHGRLHGDVEVHLTDVPGRPTLIPVAGEVVRSIDCWPSTLVLPRRVGNGLVYSDRVLLVNRDGRPVRIEVESRPPEVSAVIRPDAGREDRHWLDVECLRRDRNEPRSASGSRIRLRVHREGVVTSVDLPVLFTENPS